MKNNTLLLILFNFLTNLAYSQITISQGDLPLSNEQYYYSNVADFVTIDLNQAGANQNWDFSNLTALNMDSVITEPVSNTPITYQFYFSNQFMYPDYYSTYAQKGIDISAFSQISITDRYDFYKVSSSKHEIVGFGANINGLPSSVKYDTIDQLYPLSMTYGTSDSTTASYLIAIPSLGTYGQWIRREIEVDSWGTITTPYATYNALRVKTTLNQRDTLYVDQLMYGTSFDRPTEIIYEWIATNEGLPVFSVTTQGSVINAAKYIDQAPPPSTNIIDFTKVLDVYPNPVEDVLYIQGKNQNEVEIYSLSGKIISRWTNTNYINVSNIAKGTYLIKVISEESTLIKKFNKI